MLVVGVAEGVLVCCVACHCARRPRAFHSRYVQYTSFLFIVKCACCGCAVATHESLPRVSELGSAISLFRPAASKGAARRSIV